MLKNVYQTTRFPNNQNIRVPNTTIPNYNSTNNTKFNNFGRTTEKYQNGNILPQKPVTFNGRPLSTNNYNNINMNNQNGYNNMNMNNQNGYNNNLQKNGKEKENCNKCKKKIPDTASPDIIVHICNCPCCTQIVIPLYLDDIEIDVHISNVYSWFTIYLPDNAELKMTTLTSDVVNFLLMFGKIIQ